MDIEEVIFALQELLEEEDFPKQIKDKIALTISSLQKMPDDITVSRALHALGDAADNANLQSHHRMQLFNLVSLLENY